jgi:hypothetical protein
VGGKEGGQGGEMTQALCAHMNNKTIKKKKKRKVINRVKLGNTSKEKKGL